MIALGLVFEVVAAYAGRPAGHRGAVGGLLDARAFDWHVELPIDDVGVPHELVRVIEVLDDGERATPFRAWCEQTGVAIVCPWCGIDATSAPAPCPARPADARGQA